MFEEGCNILRQFHLVTLITVVSHRKQLKPVRMT